VTNTKASPTRVAAHKPLTAVFGALVALLLFAAAPPARATTDLKSAQPGAAIHFVKAAPEAVEAAGGHAEAHHGLPAAAPTFGDRSKGAWVNSSMIVTWIVAALVIMFATFATRRIRASTAPAEHVPSGAENLWEFLVESLHGFLSEIIGPVLAKKTFWFFATVFIFILATNWFGLLPGVGTIGWGHKAADGSFIVETPIFRGGNADLNMTLALAIVFFVMWLVWALQANGVVGFLKHLFAPKGDTKGALKLMMIAVFLFAGVLEVISIAFRPVSLSFRLYGNIFAGENLLESMQGLVPALGWLIPVPFYFMELLVGLVQALVFMLLTAVFTLLICTHDEEAHEEGHAHH
jgi:F-type H+-transporting ATPase subunit a